MSYLLAGALAVALFYGVGKLGRLLKRPDWRMASGGAAIGLFTAAAFVAIRGGWIKAAFLGLIGLGLALSTRWPRLAAARAEGMSLQEARSLLGVGPEASVADVKAAYARLIRIVHPDHGGADGLAAQLNRARDRLLKG